MTPNLRQVLRALTGYLIKEDLYSARLKFNSWISIQLYKVYNMLKVCAHGRVPLTSNQKCQWRKVKKERV